MSQASKLAALVDRVVDEINTIRTEITDAPATFDDATLTGTTTLGASNADVVRIGALELEVDTRTGTVGYTSGNVTSVTEKDGATTVRSTAIGWSAGRVTTITETVGSTTVTTTLSYDGSGNFTGWSKAVT